MKKRIWWILAIALAVAVCAGAWSYGYFTHKSNDNLPPLTAISQMTESEVNSLLPGYHIEQLREVWGEPDRDEHGTAVWQVGERTLLVAYKNNGTVAICGLKNADGSSAE